jgi:hypothetical protein
VGEGYRREWGGKTTWGNDCEERPHGERMWGSGGGLRGGVGMEKDVGECL